MVHISCELFLACVFVSSRDAPTLAITTTDLKPSGWISTDLKPSGYGRVARRDVSDDGVGLVEDSRGEAFC